MYYPGVKSSEKQNISTCKTLLFLPVVPREKSMPRVMFIDVLIQSYGHLGADLALRMSFDLKNQN